MWGYGPEGWPNFDGGVPNFDALTGGPDGGQSLTDFDGGGSGRQTLTGVGGRTTLHDTLGFPPFRARAAKCRISSPRFDKSQRAAEIAAWRPRFAGKSLHLRALRAHDVTPRVKSKNPSYSRNINLVAGYGLHRWRLRCRCDAAPVYGR